MSTYTPGEILGVLDRLDALGPRVNAHRGPLGPAAYAAALHGADLVLLPYEPNAYAVRGSAVFTEAIIHGKPVVAPAGTWMGDLIHDGRVGGTVFRRFAAAALADAAIAALDDIDCLSAITLANRVAWARDRSIGAYLDALVSEAPVFTPASLACR
jgi:glycosyltransferase involved in cell wall biosynthesis